MRPGDEEVRGKVAKMAIPAVVFQSVSGTIAVPEAGIAQLVERDVANVKVASSNLVSRSNIKAQPCAGLFCGRESAVGHPPSNTLTEIVWMILGR